LRESLAKAPASARRGSRGPGTLPSHASLFTGRYPTELRADYRRGLEPGIPTLASVLRGRGYRTLGITGNEYYTAWDAHLGRDFDEWRDYQSTPWQVLLSAWPWQMQVIRDIERARSPRAVLSAIRRGSPRAPTTLSFAPRHATNVSREFLSWQAALPTDVPFLAFLNLFDAHRPRYATRKFLTRFTPTPRGRDYYDAAIAYMDAEVGVILDSLRARGILDQTLVVITGDHGELFGEHGLFGHSTSAWRDVLWVPLVMRYPTAIPAGTQVDQAVSLRDVAATILDIAAPDLVGAPLPGVSLASLLRKDANGEATSPVFSYAHQGVNVNPEFPNGRGPVTSLRLDSLHYIRDGRGVEHLFNLTRDSTESVDLAMAPHLAQMLHRARGLSMSLARDKAR
jgi:arylsulfatase A-like enzyme